MSSLTNTVKLFYREICKEVSLKNITKYRQYIDEEISKYNSKNYNLEKLIEINTFLEEYTTMLKHIRDENKLLENYNINVRRDSTKKIENVANYVGLKL
jgi:hypothetical protein